MRLAGATGAAIISADSRQVYRGFDIGTSKPSAAERARVPHFGIDVADPSQRFSAAQWAEAVPAWLADATVMNRAPLVVGGTGFYLRALVTPLFEAPDLHEGRRHALERYLATLADAELRRWVQVLDPPRAHLGPAQLRRAIETALLAGARISDLHATRARATSVVARYLLVDPGRSLAATIAARVDHMLDQGWVDEVRALAARVPEHAPAWTATGYDLLRAVVTGDVDLDHARQQIVIRTRQYAKRQRTWFRHQLPAGDTTVIDPREPGAFDRALAWWREED
jgi:tRNA dimethylallyltransferase